MKIAVALFLTLTSSVAFCANPVASATFTGGGQGRIDVQVKVNHAGPFPFLFDTGSMSIISLDLAHQLGIKVSGTTTIQAFGGTITTGTAVVDSFNLGDLTMNRMQVTVIDGGPFVRGGLSGMLGREFLIQLVVDVDYERGTLRFFDPSNYAYAGAGIRLPVNISEAQAITIPVRVFGVDTHIQIDSGSEAPLVLFPAFVQSHHLHSDLKAITGYGYGGLTRAMVTRAPAVELGKLKIGNPIVHLSLDMNGIEAGHEDGNMGGPLLRQFTWTFDLPHSAVYIQPNAWFGGPELADKSGLVLDPRGASARVLFVYPHSPAAAAGINTGDGLKNEKGQALTSDQWHDLLDGATGTRLVVTAQHGAHTHKVVLVLKPYL